jgi:hypothetical protein
MIQQFVMNDGTKPEYKVIRQASRKFDEMTIQITKVCIGMAWQLRHSGRLVENDLDDLAPVIRYIYEEINNDDLVQYCTFYNEGKIWEYYPWFFEKCEIAARLAYYETALKEQKTACKKCAQWECGYCGEPKYELENKIEQLRNAVEREAI